jgi:hypothetical protein
MTKKERRALDIPATAKLRSIGVMRPAGWQWAKCVDEDGHPYWTCASAYSHIWLSGGDAGEYLTEHGTSHSTLEAAQVEVRRHWETG